MKTIVYLVEQPLDERNYDRFGIQSWTDSGWNVEVWDLTPWAYPRAWKNFIETGYKFKEFAGYFPIATKRQLMRRNSASGGVGHFIDFTGEHLCSMHARLSLMRRGAARVICSTGSIPIPDDNQKRGTLSKIRKIFVRGPMFSARWLISVLVAKVTAKFCTPEMAAVSGQESLASAGQSREILKAHNFDYDIYLRLRRSQQAAAADYVVFIDQDYCFHSDNFYYEIPFLMTPERYFPAVCNGLRAISQTLGVAVKIAAHPRASYRTKTHDYFEGFPVEYGKVGELIRDCKAVVCHDSTAIQLAVLFSKPLIFVTTDELIPSMGGKSTAKVASVFGKSAINLDRDLHTVDWQKELSVDARKYAEYKTKYIKLDGSPEIPFWQIVIDRIASLPPRPLRRRQ
jgi:hypothetical protein